MSNLNKGLAPSNANQQNHDIQKKRVISVLLTVFGLLCFTGLLLQGGFESFWKLTNPDYPWLFAAFSGTGLAIFIFSIRWGSIVNSLVGRQRITYVESYLYSLTSLLAGSFIPHTASTTIGKAAALTKFKGVPLRDSGASVLLDKLFDGFFMLMFFWPVFLLIASKFTVAQVVLICLLEFIVATTLIVINYSLWIRLLQGIISSVITLIVLLPFLKKYTQLQNVQTLYNIKELELLKKRVVLRSYFLTALGQVMLAVRSWLAAMAIGLNMITPLETFVAIGLVQASIVISFTPGALGFADGAWFIALESSGVPKEIIAVFIVAHRIIENMAIFLCWFPLYLYKIWGPKVSEKEKIILDENDTK